MKPTDDIQLTAYALGELSAAERAEIEARLPSDPAARAAVEEIRALAAQLETELKDNINALLAALKIAGLMAADAGGEEPTP